MTDLVSIIIPCYNQAQYLDETLLSVLNQTHVNWECIIVNDGSPDHTEEVAKKWVSKDSRFKYLNKENGGLSSARNFGIENAKGDYLQFLDSDDFLDEHKLELSLNELNKEENKGKKVVISNFRMFADNSNITSIPYCKLTPDLFNFESLLYQWDDSFSIPIHCGFFHVSLFDHLRFSESLKAKEDWVMWVNLFHSDCKAAFIDKPLALYRRNVESMTMTKDMLPDFIKAYSCLKPILSENEFDRLSVALISRYYKSAASSKRKINNIKQSNTYKFGLLTKKILMKFGVLKPFRFLFLKFLHLNKSKKNQ